MKAQITSMFRRIFEPVVTGHPGKTPHKDMMMLPDGEIRSYGIRLYTAPDGTPGFDSVVRKSFDYGLSWFDEEFSNETSPGASVRSPVSGDWIALVSQSASPEDRARMSKIQFPHDGYIPAVAALPCLGVWVFRSKNGPDGPFVHEKIFDEPFHIQRLPLPLKKRPGRWIMSGEAHRGRAVHALVVLSDDDGKTWKRIDLPDPPIHKVEWPHGGPRWLYCGTEPVIAEYPDGRLHMLIRTSADYHYQSFSEDGGETWSEFKPSPFYSVATMPNLMTLSDGRMLAVWNNTTPLPELDHALQPELDESGRDGTWEDVFTNRDAIHAAVSDDMGKTWRGFREILLNPVRDAIDFRTRGGTWESFDRSVHQNQVIELPENKILLACGQHSACQSFVLFDLNYLYGTTRSDDFRSGLVAWSVHQYIRSHSGGFRYAGHCAWNRRPGACLMPALDGSPREELMIARHPDDRLVCEKEGAVWNFPAFKKGRVTIRLTLPPGSRGMRICLADRWFNPTDPVVQYFTPFVFELDSVGRIEKIPALETGRDTVLTIEYDQTAGTACFRTDNGREGAVPMKKSVTGAVSYLHMQTLAESADPVGVRIASVAFEAR